MPGNEVEDEISKFCEPENSLQGQRLPRAVHGNWPLFDYNQQAGRQVLVGAPLNLKNCKLRQIDSVKGKVPESINLPFNQDYTQLAPRPEYYGNLTINNPLNTNDFLLGSQNFQSKQNQPGIFGENSCYDQPILTSRDFSIFKGKQENDCADSPTLTTNSERSEITEASSDINFLRGCQLVRDQLFGVSQPHPMQQSGYNDMQLLQQHMMIKQLQEIQRQQHLQQLGDARQQNSLNQFSVTGRQASGSPLINGTPVHDAPQVLRNWMQQGASPAAEGVSNKMFSQQQAQALRSMGLASSQIDVSLYGTPISNMRGNMSQYPNFQGISHDTVNLLTKTSGQAQKSIMQPSDFGNPFLDQSPDPSDLVNIPQGALISKQGFLAKDNFGQVPMQDLNEGVFPGNLQECNIQQVNAPMKEFNGGQEQSGWHEMQQTAKQLGASQDLVPLDPMEAKILYNMDDNIWDAFGGRPTTGFGGLGNVLEHPDSSSAFPSIQSGSWSALMQSAVAETSGSETGMQEEWSGLTFQNAEHSTDNQISNFMDSGKQHTGWVNSNLQSASSLSSKSLPMIADSSMSSGFPGFQQPGIHLSIEQREDACKSGSHQSIENYNSQQQAFVGNVHKFQTFINSNNTMAGQMFEHSQSAQHQRVASGDTSMDNKGMENMKSMERFQRQLSNGPSVVHNSFQGANETYEKQQNWYQRENSSDCYNSEELSGHGQGQLEQLKLISNVSSSAMDVDKGPLADIQGHSRGFGGLRSRGDQDSNKSTTFDSAALPDASNITAQTSDNMLELLHKVDQSRNDGRITSFGSTDCKLLPESPGANALDSSAAQPYVQSLASQGFGLRLAPPSQRLAHSNNFPFPQGLAQSMSNLKPRPVNPELGERNQTWLTPPTSFQSLPPSNEPLQRTRWENKSITSGRAGFSSHSNVQGNSVSSFISSSPPTTNQLQLHSPSNVPGASQSLQMPFPGNDGRFPPYQGPSQDTSQQIFTNCVTQQFPVLEATPVSQPPFLSPQSDTLAKQQNVWRNVPTKQQSLGNEHLKIQSILPSSMDPSNNSVISDSWTQVSNDRSSMKVEYKSSEIMASNSQGFDYVHPGKATLQQQISSRIPDTSQVGGISQGKELVSDANVLNSGSFAFHSQHQVLDRASPGNSPVPASSDRNLEASCHSHNQNQNYSLLHQMQAMNDSAASTSEVQQVTTFGGQQAHDNSSRLRHSMDGGLSSASQSNTKKPSFSEEARSGVNATPSLPALQGRPLQEMAMSGHNDSLMLSGNNNVLTNQTDQVNLHMAPSWLKQYGSLRNGQMVPTLDTRLAKAAALQLSFGQAAQKLHMHTSLEQMDAADAGQVSKVGPSTVSTLQASQRLSGPYFLPLEATDQGVVMRPKKRKVAISKLLPWHKEVTQDSRRLENISVAEEDWARATNRLIDKVEHEVDIIDDALPMFRSKRRLILTTQLMQQLFCPPPASLFSADSLSNCDIVSYFVSRLSLGDACSLAWPRNDLLAPISGNNRNSDESKVLERNGDQKLLEVTEEFINRAKKLEDDFRRLERTASVVDLRVETQELERFSVINRFARFHIRGQMDTSGISSSSGTLKPVPQRYVIAFPFPKNLPEGAHCLAL